MGGGSVYERESQKVNNQVGNVRREEVGPFEGAFIRTAALFAPSAQSCSFPSEKPGDNTPQVILPRTGTRGICPLPPVTRWVRTACVRIKGLQVVLLPEKLLGRRALGLEMETDGVLGTICR